MTDNSYITILKAYFFIAVHTCQALVEFAVESETENLSASQHKINEFNPKNEK